MPTESVKNLLYTIRTFALAVTIGLFATTAHAAIDLTNPLIAASGSIESLVERVSGSVVQIVVTGLQPASAPRGAAVTRGRSVGSGFVVDRGGYIITNAHVIHGAEQIDVIIATDGSGGGRQGLGPARILPAAIIGVVEEWDLALLRVDADLEPLALADYDSVRQGQLVFAFGSPDGLRNSVTMGMVSAVARQMERDSPLVYIQTDAAINPGNSGGPLVNTRGEVVGVDTFIRSSAGGSDGLGFALPSSLVSLAYPQLRDFGHLRRAVIGVVTQTVTPVLAAGLGLPSSGGVIVSDVAAGSPAAAAGLRVGDVITAIDGEQVDEVAPARLYLQMASLKADRVVTLTGMRSGKSFVVEVTPVDVADDQRVSIIDSGSMAVEPLAMLGLPYRADGVSGVVVAARLDTPQAEATDLAIGDLIVSVNGEAVDTVPALRAALAGIGPRRAVVLQVARAGRLSYLAFTLD